VGNPFLEYNHFIFDAGPLGFTLQQLQGLFDGS
jgi:hypothetical protein